jgi:hypothetical protein
VSDAFWYVVALALYIGLPLTGLVAAALVGFRPLSALSHWWSVMYGAAASTICFWWTVRYWWPDDGLWNGFHLVAALVAVDALTMSVLLWRLHPQSRAFSLFRVLCALACLLSAVAVFLVLAGGSGQ